MIRDNLAVIAFWSDPAVLSRLGQRVAPQALVMIEKYASDEAVAEHSKGAGLAKLRTTLEGKLSSEMGVQVLAPHPAGLLTKGARRT